MFINEDNVADVLSALVAKAPTADGGVAPESSVERSSSEQVAPNQSLQTAPDRPGGLVPNDAGSSVLADLDMEKDLGSHLHDSISAIMSENARVAGEREALEHLKVLARERRRLDAAYLEAIAVVDQLNAACLTGSATSTHAYLRAVLGASPGRAKADVAAAQAVHGERSRELVATPELRSGPLAPMGELLSDGATSMGHVDAGVKTLEKLPARVVCPENLDRITNFLTEQAPVTTPREMRIFSDRLIRSLEPDRDDHYDPESFNRRSFSMSTDITGMVHGSYQLDPAAGAELRAILEPLSAPKPGQKDEEGNLVARDTRTAAQRRADAFGELIRAGATYLGPPVVAVSEQDHATEGTAEKPTLFEISTDKDGKPASKAGKLRLARRPTRVSIVTTMEQIAAMESNRPKGAPATGQEAYGQFTPVDPTPSHCPQIGPISAGTVARLSCDGLFERVVLDAKGAALDLGQPVRLASPAQRRALAVRDGGCVVPGCDRPPNWCEVHHIIWYSRGGPTDVENEGLFCTSDHSYLHAGLLEAKMIDGIPYVRLTEKALAKGHSGFLAGAVRHPEHRDWVRNGYFDRLKSADAAARAIVLSSAANKLAA